MSSFIGVLLGEIHRKPDGTFAKGHAFSPGRPKIPYELRQFSAELRHHIIEAFKKDLSYFDKIKKDPKGFTMLEITVAKYVFEASCGSVDHLKILLDRTLGRVKDAPEIQEDDGSSDKNLVLDLVPREKLIELIQGKK